MNLFTSQNAHKFTKHTTIGALSSKKTGEQDLDFLVEKQELKGFVSSNKYPEYVLIGEGHRRASSSFPFSSIFTDSSGTGNGVSTLTRVSVGGGGTLIKYPSRVCCELSESGGGFCSSPLTIRWVSIKFKKYEARVCKQNGSFVF